MSGDGKNQDQEPEHTRFYRLDRSWSFDGEDHVISVAAYKLHITSTADAALGGHPGFVPDEYLNSLDPSTTLAAPEPGPDNFTIFEEGDGIGSHHEADFFNQRVGL